MNPDSRQAQHDLHRKTRVEKRELFLDSDIIEWGDHDRDSLDSDSWRYHLGMGLSQSHIPYLLH